jgi:hypothetical protein
MEECQVNFGAQTTDQLLLVFPKALFNKARDSKQSKWGVAAPRQMPKRRGIGVCAAAQSAMDAQQLRPKERQMTRTSNDQKSDRHNPTSRDYQEAMDDPSRSLDPEGEQYVHSRSGGQQQEQPRSSESEKRS